MAKIVVDFFEEINIANNETEIDLGRFSISNRRRQDPLEFSAIGDAGQRIDGRFFFQRVKLLLVVHFRRGVVQQHQAPQTHPFLHLNRDCIQLDGHGNAILIDQVDGQVGLGLFIDCVADRAIAIADDIARSRGHSQNPGRPNFPQHLLGADSRNAFGCAIPSQNRVLGIQKDDAFANVRKQIF